MLSFKEFLKHQELSEQDEPLPQEPMETPHSPMQEVYYLYLRGGFG